MKLPPQNPRNPLVVPMMSRKAIHIKDRRTRRAKDARRSWRREDHG